MKPRVSDEIKAKLLAGLYEDLMPDPPPPKPKPKLEAEVLPFPPILSEQELCRRQELLDLHWKANLAAQRELEAEAGSVAIVGLATLIGKSLRTIRFGENENE